MIEVLSVLLFALLWTLLVGYVTLFNLLVGTLLGLFLLSIVRHDERSFPRRLWAFVRYLRSFSVELAIANVSVARLALSRRPRLYPHILAIPIRVRSDAAISLLSATITLLPGTVAMGVSEDRKLLYAHAINVADLEEARASVTRMETLILGFMS